MPFPYFSAIASGGRVRSTVISRLLDALRYLKGITDDDAVIEVEKPVSPYRSTTPSGSTRAIGTDASGNAHYFDGTAWKSYGASDFGGFAVTPADSPIRKVGSFPDVNLELIDDPGALSPGAPTQPLGILAKHILDGTLTPDKIEASSSHSAGDLLLVSRRNGSMGWGKFLPQTNVTLSGGKGIVIEESGTTFTVSVDAQANWLTPELIKDGSVGLNDFAPGLLFTADKIKDGSVTPEHLSASGSAFLVQGSHEGQQSQVRVEGTLRRWRGTARHSCIRHCSHEAGERQRLLRVQVWPFRDSRGDCWAWRSCCLPGCY